MGTLSVPLLLVACFRRDQWALGRNAVVMYSQSVMCSE